MSYLNHGMEAQLKAATMTSRNDQPPPSGIAQLKDYLLFKKYIMPSVLQLFFWAGIGGTLYGTWWLYAHDNWAWVMSLIFGTLTTRLIFESLLIRYQTYILLKEIHEKLDQQS